MVVLGGLGSIRGVVLAALFVAFLQSVILQDLTEYVHTLGRLVGSPFLQRVELITSLELIFGLILVLMMIFRREGLWPAVRKVSALTREEQTAAPSRGASLNLDWARPPAVGGPGRPLLEIESLRKSFGGVAAADDITLTVHAGELVSVIGPNGSGKTTLFNLITGLIAPDRGSIRLEGLQIDGRPPHVRGCGLIVFSACSHAGVVNVLTHARSTFPDVPLFGVFGGLHLSGVAMERLIPDTVAHLRPFGLRQIMDVALDFAERITVLHFGQVVVEGTRAEVVAHPRTREIYLGE